MLHVFDEASTIPSWRITEYSQQRCH